MSNPFEEDCSQQSVTLEQSREATLPYSLAPDERPSPIALLQFDRLSEQFLTSDGTPTSKTDKKLQSFLKEIKSYSQGLQKRNLEMACELERERMKNQQLTTALGCLIAGEQERAKAVQERLSRLSEKGNRFEIEFNRRQMVEAEVKALRAENNHLKDLVLIANDNYQQLEQRNAQLMQQCTSLEKQQQQRELENLNRTQEMKGMLAALMGDKPEKEAKSTSNHNSTPVGNCGKPRREQAEEAYRSIFSKTLRGRKENINKQI